MTDKISLDIEIRYSEIDAMGIVHHKNYWSWFEILRIKWLEKKSYSYDKMEKNGLFLPVISAEIKYIKSLKFGDQINIIAQVNRPKLSVISFDYQIILNKQQTTLANTKHVFVDANGKAIKIPANFAAILPSVN